MGRTAQCGDFASVQPFNRRSDRTYANVHGGACERRSGGCRSGISGLVRNATGGARSHTVPFQNVARGKFREIARCNTREHGKTLIESRGDVQRGIEMVEFACGMPSLLDGETLENIARGIDCETIRQPLGVCVGITPFNFPAMVPLWMYPVALACGNTFVLKPSEKVPLTAMMIAQLLEQAGLPHGVFNIVHGGRECVEALLTHPKVKAISFVGSTPVAKYIFEAGTRQGKRVQSNGGAKNFVFLMPDADVEQSTRSVVEGAFGCAGERCMAGSTAVVVGSAATRCFAFAGSRGQKHPGRTHRSRAAARHGTPHYSTTSRSRGATHRNWRETRCEKFLPMVALSSEQRRVFSWRYRSR